MMGELFGRRTGYSQGAAGSMHIADAQIGILGANGIVGAGLPIATGAGYTASLRASGQVSVCFFGDGAVNGGAFHESLNMASLWQLPVIYVCENNGYAEMTPQSVHFAGTSVADRARSYGMHAERIQGHDIERLYASAKEAVDRARASAGPTLLEVMVDRWHGHFEGDRQPYRPKAELQAIRGNDAIERFAAALREAGVADDDWFSSTARDAERAIAEAIAFAEGSPVPVLDDMFANVYARPAQ
jgi:acetoin:2,6-dichlorophenolindophenol oxidoreductase subunit alpha